MAEPTGLFEAPGNSLSDSVEADREAALGVDLMRVGVYRQIGDGTGLHGFAANPSWYSRSRIKLRWSMTARPAVSDAAR